VTPASTRKRLLRRFGPHALGFVLVVAVFGFVLPRVANYGAVWTVITGLSAVWIAALAAVGIVNVLTFAPPWVAALPGLRFLDALVMTQASTTASNVLPGGDAIGMAVSYSMLRRWGFRVEQVAIATAAFSIWNVIANVLFAVAGVALLGLGGESNALLSTAALIGGIVGALLIAGLVLVMRDERYARLIGAGLARIASGARRLVRRPPVTGWPDRLAEFRHEALGLVRRRWLSLTLATLAGHLSVFVVLLVALRSVGVPAGAVGFEEVFAAWALVRIIQSIPITPGGLGVVELGLTGALVGFGGHRVDVVAAVLVYRVLTYVPPIAIGGVCLLVWRRIRRDPPGVQAART
jgi:uncharacterized membrane protein YbhN (UPF0104 family)